MELRVDDELVLRSLEEADAARLFALVDASREHLRAWLPWLDGTRSAEDCRAFIFEQHLRGSQVEELVPFGIFEDARILGVAGYNWIDDDVRSTGLGYWLGRSEQGRGIMTRCVRALTLHGFDALDLLRVEVHVAAENAASRAVAERLGFAVIGTESDAEWLYDHSVDHVIYGFCREQADALRAWRARPR